MEARNALLLKSFQVFVIPAFKGLLLTSQDSSQCKPLFEVKPRNFLLWCLTQMWSWNFPEIFQLLTLLPKFTGHSCLWLLCWWVISQGRTWSQNNEGAAFMLSIFTPPIRGLSPQSFFRIPKSPISQHRWARTCLSYSLHSAPIPVLSSPSGSIFVSPSRSRLVWPTRAGAMAQW